MATTNLNVRVDENLKKTADALLNELGLNMSTAINIYLKQLSGRTAYRLKSNLISQMQKPSGYAGCQRGQKSSRSF